MRPGARFLIGVLAVLAAIWLKVRVESAQRLTIAQKAESSQPMVAVTAYRQAIRWYSPGSGPVDDAVASLERLGGEYDSKDPELALMSWRALRSALFAVRSFYQPYPDKIDLANGHIARLMAAQEAPDPALLAEREAHHLTLLARDHAPNVGWSLLAVLSFLAWGGALLMFAAHAFDPDTGALKVPAARRWGLTFVAAYALWVTGLLLA